MKNTKIVDCSPATGSLTGGPRGYRSAPVRPLATPRWGGEQASPEVHQSGDEVAARTDIERHPVRHSQWWSELSICNLCFNVQTPSLLVRSTELWSRSPSKTSLCYASFIAGNGPGRRRKPITAPACPEGQNYRNRVRVGFPRFDACRRYSIGKHGFQHLGS